MTGSAASEIELPRFGLIVTFDWYLPPATADPSFGKTDSASQWYEPFDGYGANVAYVSVLASYPSQGAAVPCSVKRNSGAGAG
jgi:hypothetical protein